MAQDISNPVQVIAAAHVIGQPDKVTVGYGTDMRLSSGEDWMVPCDRGGQDFEDWLRSVGPNQTGLLKGGALPRSVLRDLLQRAWEASRQRHTAKLRRVGWLDQKGRVWTRIPATAEFDGGSLTPLLIDVREG